MDSMEVCRYFQLIDIGSDFVIYFSIVYLLKAHRHLVSSKAKELIKEKETQSSAKFSV